MTTEKDKKEYLAFLESSCPLMEEIEGIDVPTVYKSISTPVRDWDGNSSLPAISKDENLDAIIGKILKKEPDDAGAEDPDRDDSDNSVMNEYGNLANDAKKKVEGSEEDVEEDDCPECEKKIEELYSQLGISPLSLLEEDEEDDDDDDDEKDDEEEDDDDDDDKAPSFTATESRILEALIHELNEEGEKEDDEDEKSDEEEEDDIDIEEED